MCASRERIILVPLFLFSPAGERTERKGQKKKDFPLIFLLNRMYQEYPLPLRQSGERTWVLPPPLLKCQSRRECKNVLHAAMR